VCNNALKPHVISNNFMINVKIENLEKENLRVPLISPGLAISPN